MEHFGNTLRALLKDKKLSHKSVSDRLGIKPQRFYQITKMADVKLKTAITILNAIDTEIQEFLDYEKFINLPLEEQESVDYGADHYPEQDNNTATTDEPQEIEY